MQGAAQGLAYRKDGFVPSTKPSLNWCLNLHQQIPLPLGKGGGWAGEQGME